VKRPFAGAVAVMAAVIAGSCLLVLMRARAQIIELPRLGTVPAFSFTNQLGQPFSTANLDGRVWVADFVFTSCPEICPRMTEEMAKLQTYLVNRALPVKLVSVSVDPARDTPDKLLAFAQHFHARPDVWTFLTGPAQEVEDAVVGGFKQTMTREKDPAQQDGFAILHGTRFVIVDGKRQIRGYYDPNDGEAMARLRRDLSTLVEHGGT
jgi:protein SCO1/2